MMHTFIDYRSFNCHTNDSLCTDVSYWNVVFFRMVGVLFNSTELWDYRMYISEIELKFRFNLPSFPTTSVPLLVLFGDAPLSLSKFPAFIQTRFLVVMQNFKCLLLKTRVHIEKKEFSHCVIG